jgi:hypothetical protein
MRTTQFTGLAIAECKQSSKPGLWNMNWTPNEFRLLQKRCTSEASYSIVQSGPNARIGHYNVGKGQIRNGDFLLMDFEPDYGYNMSDLTRMWPLNWRFGPSQREHYEFYAGSYRAILSAIKPGMTTPVGFAVSGQRDGRHPREEEFSEATPQSGREGFCENISVILQEPPGVFARSLGRHVYARCGAG